MVERGVRNLISSELREIIAVLKTSVGELDAHVWGTLGCGAPPRSAATTEAAEAKKVSPSAASRRRVGNGTRRS